MSEDKRMAEDELADSLREVEDELDLDSESEGDLEAVMQEALEAVEKASQSAKARASEGAEVELAPPRPGARDVPDADRLEGELAVLRDRSARTLADFDNFRKRVERDRAEERRYAALDFLREFLTIVDNLERAISAEGPAEDLKAGVELIHRQMKELLRASGVRRVAALGEEFDPRFHEAVSQHEDSTVEVPTVSDELQAGYLMHERLLRPAVVRVAMPPEGEADENANTDKDEVEES